MPGFGFGLVNHRQTVGAPEPSPDPTQPPGDLDFSSPQMSALIVLLTEDF